MTKMHKVIRGLTLATLVGIAAVGLTACVPPTPPKCQELLSADANDAAKKNEVALVIAPTTSFVNFRDLIPAITPNVQAAMGHGGSRLSVVLADGTPGVATYTDIDGNQPSVDVENDQTYAINRTEDVYDCAIGDPSVTVDPSVTIDPELDVLKGLRVAADSFDANNAGSTKHIVVLSNALQTTAPWPMQKDGIPPLNTVNGVVAQLKANGGLPDLKGATVDFIGLGHVSKSAPSLNQQSIDSLESFWTGIVEASNGHVGTIQREVTDTQPAKGSIPVTAAKALPDPCLSAVITEDDGARFAPNTATFIDAGAAAASAKKIAAQIALKPDCTGVMSITGFVASGVDKAQYKFGNAADAHLSLARAQAFAGVLKQAGVKSKIVCVGGGKGPYNDWDQNGKYVEARGKKNRIVMVSQ